MPASRSWTGPSRKKMTRKMSDLRHTVDFLGKFSEPEGFKYLTHRFDDDSIDFLTIVNRCRVELVKYHNMLPQNLFRLMYGFLYGPEWSDAYGRVHKEHCACDKWVDWCIDNKGVHPREAFKEHFEEFRNSVRIYNGTLDEYMQDLSDSGLYQGIEIEVDERSLSRFDSYIDVQTFRRIVTSILKEISDFPTSSEYPAVRISCDKGELRGDGTKIDVIRIENAGSFPRQGRAQAKAHLDNGGGFLSSLSKLAEGNMLLSIETSWDGDPCRWNILRMDGEEEFVDIDRASATGFTYILRILHKS